MVQYEDSFIPPDTKEKLSTLQKKKKKPGYQVKFHTCRWDAKVASDQSSLSYNLLCKTYLHRHQWEICKWNGYRVRCPVLIPRKEKVNKVLKKENALNTEEKAVL